MKTHVNEQTDASLLAILEDAILESFGFVALKDKNLQYLRCNWSFANLFKITPDMIVGKTNYDLLPHEEAEEQTKADLKIIKTGQKTEDYLEMQIDGNTYEILRIKKPVISYNGVVGLIIKNIDLTKERRLTRQLLEAKNVALKASAQLLEDINKINWNFV